MQTLLVVCFGNDATGLWKVIECEIFGSRFGIFLIFWTFLKVFNTVAKLIITVYLIRGFHLVEQLARSEVQVFHRSFKKLLILTGFANGFCKFLSTINLQKVDLTWEKLKHSIFILFSSTVAIEWNRNCEVSCENSAKYHKGIYRACGLMSNNINFLGYVILALSSFW